MRDVNDSGNVLHIDRWRNQRPRKSLTGSGVAKSDLVGILRGPICANQVYIINKHTELLAEDHEDLARRHVSAFFFMNDQFPQHSWWPSDPQPAATTSGSARPIWTTFRAVRHVTNVARAQGTIGVNSSMMRLAQGEDAPLRSLKSFNWIIRVEGQLHHLLRNGSFMML